MPRSRRHLAVAGLLTLLALTILAFLHESSTRPVAIGPSPRTQPASQHSGDEQSRGEATTIAPRRGRTRPNAQPSLVSEAGSPIDGDGTHGLRGHVVEPSGEGVVGARVRVVPADSQSWIRRAMQPGDLVGETPLWLEAHTDADGAFVVANLSPDRTWVALALSPAGSVSPLTAPLDPRALPDDLRLEVPASGRLLVRVRDEQDAPVRDAMVRLGTRQLLLRSAEHDGDGTYVIDDVAPGPTRLRIAASGRVPQQLTREVLTGKDTTIVVRLDRGVALSGVVVDSRGTPIPRAEVRVRGGDVEQATRTAADGRFLVGGLVDGDVRVLAWGEDHDRASVATRAPAAGVYVVLEPLAVMTWRIRLPQGTATATGDVLLQTFRGEGDSDPVSGVAGWSRRSTALTFVDGVATVIWKTLGHARMVVSTREFAPAFVSADAKPGERLDLGTVTLGPGRTVHGRVEDDRRRPVTGARIFVRERPTSKQQDVRSGDDGAFTLTQLGDGPVPFIVSARGHGGAEVVLPAAPDVAMPVVRLVRLRRVTVRVLDARSAPVVDPDVLLHRIEGGSEREAYGLTPVEGETGLFVAELAPAVYRVRLENGDGVEIDATGERDPPLATLFQR